MIYREATSGKDLRLSLVEEEQASKLYDTIVKEKRGYIVFISGEGGSGKTDILQVLADRLRQAQPQPLVLAGRFRDGRYRPWETGKRSPLLQEEFLDSLSEWLPLAARVVRPELGFVAEFVAQVLKVLGAGHKIVKNVSEQQGPSQDARASFKRLMRSATQAQPGIFLIDDAHEGDCQWNYLWLEMATEIAAEVPLLLFLTLEGPTELGSHRHGESNLLAVARDLVQRQLAEWWPLKLLSRDEIGAWVGPSAAGMLDHLLSATGGNPRWLIELWKEWQYRDVVRYSSQDNEWRWASNRPPSVNLVKDILYDRLGRLLGSDDLSETVSLLACAALEGPRFTADAVAQASNRDRDEVIDFLDDNLVQSTERPDGILNEAGSVTIESSKSDRRSLWSYTFVSHLHWRALRQYGLSKAEELKASLDLARALVEIYSPEERQIAKTLARLFEAGGNHEQAAHYQRMADYSIRREDLRHLALSVLSIKKEAWNDWDYRQATALFLQAGEEMEGTYPNAETLAVLEAAYEMARHAGLPYHQGLALYYCSRVHEDSGNYATAQEKAQEALQVFQQQGSRISEGRTWHRLGLIDYRLCEYMAAREKFQIALEIAENLGDRGGEASAWYQLGTIDLAVDEYTAARARSQRALGIMQQLGDRRGEAAVWHQLGVINSLVGQHTVARQNLQRALDMRRELDDRGGEAATMHELGLIDLKIEDNLGAREKFQRALEIQRKLGNRTREAAAVHQLGVIDLRMGDYTAAREKLYRALEICHKVGDRAGESSTWHELGSIDYRVGNFAPAYEKLQRSLEIDQQIGDRAGEAATWDQLGWVAKDMGHLLEAAGFLALSFWIRQSIGHANATISSDHLDSVASELGYAEAELAALLQEVKEAYQTDKGRKLLEVAFGK